MSGRAWSADSARAGGAARAFAWLLIAGLALGSGCAHRPPVPPAATDSSGPPSVDSATVALWRFDELGDQLVADDSPEHLDGTAGLDTQVEFGRFGRARSFTYSKNSFVVVPSDPRLDLGASFTIEAWLLVRSFPASEQAVLVARMAEAGNRRSFVFSITGTGHPSEERPHPLFASDPSLERAEPGQLWFAFVPSGAWSGLYSFLSVGTIETGRWTHVAVTYDGRTVAFYVNGQLDSQHAASGVPAVADVPLMIGNYFDPPYLTDFSGNLQVESGVDPPFLYPYDGLMDELRISRVARRTFPTAGRH